MSFSDELHRELIDLTRARALQDPALARRAGPLIRELSGAIGIAGGSGGSGRSVNSGSGSAGSGGDSARFRQRLRAWLAELAEDLPADLRRAAEEALAFAPDANIQL